MGQWAKQLSRGENRREGLASLQPGTVETECKLDQPLTNQNVFQSCGLYLSTVMILKKHTK